MATTKTATAPTANRTGGRAATASPRTDRARRAGALALLALGAVAPATIFAPSARAQNVSLDGGPQINSYARPGFPVNKILVLGAVGTPGVWQVEQGTDLLEFLTYARVQGIGLRSEGERRRTVVRVYRGGTGPREVVFESEIKPIVERRVTYPVLNEGDVLEVEDIRRLPKRRIEPLQVLGVATSVLGLVFTVVTLTRRN